MGRMIGNYFAVIDKNKDGSLDRAELKAAQAMLPQGRRRGSEAARIGTDPSVFETDVLAFNVTEVAKTISECRSERFEIFARVVI